MTQWHMEDVVRSDAQAGTDRWTFLIGGAAAIVGSLLGMVGNLVHPETPIGDPEGVARAIATSESWLPIHMAIVVGTILMLAGLVALAHAVRGDLAAALARFALAPAVAGITVGLVLVILDGVAARQLAEEWATAAGSERDIMLRVVAANETMNFALVSLLNVLLAGVAFIGFGLAVAASENFPRWLGFLAVLGGIESIAAGLLQAESGSPLAVTRILTIVGPTVFTLWLLVMGVLLVRESSRVRRVSEEARPEAVPARSVA